MSFYMNHRNNLILMTLSKLDEINRNIENDIKDILYEAVRLKKFKVVDVFYLTNYHNNKNYIINLYKKYNLDINVDKLYYDGQIAIRISFDQNYKISMMNQSAQTFVSEELLRDFLFDIYYDNIIKRYPNEIIYYK